MAESTVVFSLVINSNGGLKTRLDKADKEKVEKLAESEVERPPSPTLSLISSISTIASSNVSTASESLHHGLRRRVDSFSTESIVSSTLFEGDDENVSLRTSTPVPLEDDLSDLSFASCVSELSVKTNSSQETIKNEGVIEKKKKKTKGQINRERMQENKEEGNWRNAPRRVSEHGKSPPTGYPAALKRSTPSNKPVIIGSSVSRIPSLLDRPTFSPPWAAPQSSERKVAPPMPRALPDRRVSAGVGSYATAARTTPTHPDWKKTTSSSTSGADWRTAMSKNRSTIQSPVHAPIRASAAAPAPNAPAPITEQTIKVTLITGSDGKMRLQFSNSTSSESWLIDGIAPDAQNLNVHRIEE